MPIKNYFNYRLIVLPASQQFEQTDWSGSVCIHCQDMQWCVWKICDAKDDCFTVLLISTLQITNIFLQFYLLFFKLNLIGLWKRIYSTNGINKFSHKGRLLMFVFFQEVGSIIGKKGEIVKRFREEVSLVKYCF